MERNIRRMHMGTQQRNAWFRFFLFLSLSLSFCFYFLSSSIVLCAQMGWVWEHISTTTSRVHVIGGAQKRHDVASLLKTKLCSFSHLHYSRHKHTHEERVGASDTNYSNKTRIMPMKIKKNYNTVSLNAVDSWQYSLFFCIFTLSYTFRHSTVI